MVPVSICFITTLNGGGSNVADVHSVPRGEYATTVVKFKAYVNGDPSKAIQVRIRGLVVGGWWLVAGGCWLVMFTSTLDPLYASAFSVSG